MRLEKTMVDAERNKQVCVGWGLPLGRFLGAENMKTQFFLTYSIRCNFQVVVRRFVCMSSRDRVN